MNAEEDEVKSVLVKIGVGLFLLVILIIGSMALIFGFVGPHSPNWLMVIAGAGCWITAVWAGILADDL